ncbi:GNAT family N-acetyltransferase [Allitabrizicola rongguiensis]|uniref:GNAT family N-acetyltransferase n=1 Tax=Alitabrizicola rongguiensis TaxID=2909234 RepID=UPI0029E81DDA|nr:GNAT family N-acetyltransferase [Tabrizicola rongguiensis]
MIARPPLVQHATAPVLETARLRLRMPRYDDFAHRLTFLAADRAKWEGGPFTTEQAWRIFASEVGQWPLMGFGPFSIDDLVTGEYLGEVGIYQPEGYPEPELGWFVTEPAEGKGIAAEGAQAVMAWAAATFGWDHIDNYIDPGNDRSIALGLRLGGRKVDAPGADPTDVVIRHDLTRLPSSPEFSYENSRPPVALAGTPVLQTERLILRAPRPGDFEPCAAFLTSDRGRYVGGPLSRPLAWRAMGHLTGHWVHRGFGMFIFATREAPDTPLGMAGPWFPEGWPEHEIGWSVWAPEAEGRGYAFEAARAARDWAVRALGWTDIVSYIAPDNARSIALAERLGARLDPGAPTFDYDKPIHVYRHPRPEVRQ